MKSPPFQNTRPLFGVSRALNVARQFQLLDTRSLERILRNSLFDRTPPPPSIYPHFPTPLVCPHPLVPFHARELLHFLFPSARLRALLKRSSDTQGTCYTLEHPLVVCTDLILPLVARLLLGSSIRVSLLPLLARAVLRNMWNTCGGSILEGSYIGISLNGRCVEAKVNTKVEVDRNYLSLKEKGEWWYSCSVQKNIDKIKLINLRLIKLSNLRSSKLSLHHHILLKIISFQSNQLILLFYFLKTYITISKIHSIQIIDNCK